MPDAFVPAHIERSGRVAVAAPLAQAFLYFTPDGERLWVPGWSPQYLHPPGGPQCEGAVFRTDADGEQALWMITRFDPRAGTAEYVRMVPGSRLGTVSIRSEAASVSETVVHVTYRLTSLSVQGNRALDAFNDGFDAMIREWGALVGAVLRS